MIHLFSKATKQEILLGAFAEAQIDRMQTSQQPTRELQNISNVIRNFTFAKKLRRRSVLTLAKG